MSHPIHQNSYWLQINQQKNFIKADQLLKLCQLLDVSLGTKQRKKDIAALNGVKFTDPLESFSTHLNYRQRPQLTSRQQERLLIMLQTKKN